LTLAQRVQQKYRPVFDAMKSQDRAALAWYFLPRRSNKSVVGVTRPRILKWYCPFADQKEFPTGHRYCINVYTGCDHACIYCYAASYEPDQANLKKNFERGLLRDMEDLDKYNVPPAPVHMSNSTDAFQPLEAHLCQTLFALKQILYYRHCFTSVVLLTKNPTIAAQPKYLEILQQLTSLPSDHPRKAQFDKQNIPSLRIEVSMAFWRDEIRAFFEPGAPPVAERIDAIRKLRVTGIPIVLRIDPLLPRSPLPDGKTLVDFHLPEAQPLDNLESLVAFAAEIQAMHIVYSVAKITQPRFKPLSEVMQNLMRTYEHLAGTQNLIFRGNSWRLPNNIAQQHIVQPYQNICRRYNIPATFCKQNLIATP